MIFHQCTTSFSLHFDVWCEINSILEINDDQDVRTVMKLQESKHVNERSFIQSFIHSFIFYEAMTKAERKFWWKHWQKWWRSSDHWSFAAQSKKRQSLHWIYIKSYTELHIEFLLLSRDQIIIFFVLVIFFFYLSNLHQEVLHWDSILRLHWLSC